MFWADKLLENIKGEQVIEDAWTPSGTIHMGSLKGPVIHDVLFRVLKEKDEKAKYIYGFDDFDPIDGLPDDLKESHGKYMGVPLCNVPAPVGKGTFAEYIGDKMSALFNTLDIKPEIYKTSEVYRSGKFDEAIRIVLDNVEKIRKIYSDTYKKEISEDWFPLQVVCPICGKIGTTKVTGWDGEKVSFECSPTLVEWAAGCGEKGEISPYGGNAKMPWKIEWPSAWYTFGVTIEGSGKDHASAGGSYDIALQIIDKVFNKSKPLKFGYEFFLTGGKKMSSSKGLGLTAEDLLEILTPQAARFLMIRTRPEQTVEFDPRSPDIIPRIYDDYQKGASLTNEDDLGRAFELSQVGEIEKVPTVRFSVIAQWVQMPGMEEEIKKAGAENWASYAKVWIEKYAPDSEKFLVQKELPDVAKNLSVEQRQYLAQITEFLPEKENIEEFQTKIYEVARDMNLAPKEAFAAIYTVLIGKDHGPKAAWLISSLEIDFLKDRFEMAVSQKVEVNEATLAKYDSPEIFSIDKTLAERYPSISVGIAIIKNVSIKKNNPELEKEKEELLKSLENLTTEELGEYPEIISYRKLYRETGIDWHSRRPSPEALLRRVALKKGLYTVNTCVDAYNLSVMKNRVSTGAFDMDKIEFPTVLRLSTSSDKIHLLGDEEEIFYKDGEIAYFDQINGISMDLNYRDSLRTAVQLDTKNLYINVDGVYDISSQKVEQVLKEVCNNIIKYCGGTLEEFGVITST